MRATVRAGRASFRIEGALPSWLLEELRRRYGKAFRLAAKAKAEPMALEESRRVGKSRGANMPGGNLRFCRLNRGLTQEQLAAQLGPSVRKQHVSNMERGKQGISKVMAKKLAALFSVGLENFI